MRVFDRHSVRRHRERAAAGFAGHGFLFDEVAARLADRLDDVRREFATILDIGARGGVMARALAARGGDAPAALGDKSTVVIHSDLAPSLLAGLPRAVVADPEALPFAGGFDLVASCLDLHWVNDLPGALVQIRRALRPDGLFLAAIFGGDTLSELREAWLAAEIEVEGGASPRISPFADGRDAGALLQRAGFALPVIDTDRITVTYADPIALMRDLRGMGETNAVALRRRTATRRATLFRAAEIYGERFADADGRIRATFEIVTMTGWAPHADQQKPLKPGSAAFKLAEALNGEPDQSARSQ
ncbi:methyltransferase family protein [Stella humosa]|uniref:Methyltransferase family protein n=2 Tax=Stella humosa TaxID=94 RepID=A0A3N1LDK9_9PROT|nr:methyltransferase family protein [Stella humosa]